MVSIPRETYRVLARIRPYGLRGAPCSTSSNSCWRWRANSISAGPPRACGVTQPTLSAGIKQLEESLGVLLVNRGSRFQGFTPEGERVLDWARRIVGDTRAMRAGVQCAATRPGRPAAHRRDPDRAADGRAAHDAVSRQASGRAVHHLVAHLDRDPRPPGKPRDRRRHHLSRQRAARPRQHGAALSGALPPAHRRRCAARRPRPGDLGRGRAGAALPADARHAEPPHHRRAARRTPAASRGRRWNPIR